MSCAYSLPCRWHVSVLSASERTLVLLQVLRSVLNAYHKQFDEGHLLPHHFRLLEDIALCALEQVFGRVYLFCLCLCLCSVVVVVWFPLFLECCLCLFLSLLLFAVFAVVCFCISVPL